jgi:phosphatidylserine decarboxylase
LPAFAEIEKQLLMQLLTDIQPRWYPLTSKRTGKKSSIVTGAVQLQFKLYDPANPSAPAQQVIAKLSGICGADSPFFDGEVAQGLERTDSGDLETEEADETELASGTDDNRTPDTAEKKRRRRMAILKRKVKRGYEFSNGTDVAGVLFIEIQKITDLPPERNGMLAIFAPYEQLLWRLIAYLQKSGYEGIASSIRAWIIWPILHQICKCCLRGKVCKSLHL